MCPVLFHIGPIYIYSYGMMVAIAFIVDAWLLSLELKRNKLDPNIGGTFILINLIAGVAGSKLLYVFETWDEFVANPSSLFSPGGLTFYGGLVLAFIVSVLYVRSKKIPVRLMMDITAPLIILGYGIGRIGCHLAGDGDYGIPSNLPWAVGYPNGVVPTPPGVTVHPTPIYEFILATAIFFFLWSRRKNIKPQGRLFMEFLILAGIERFAIEFIRLNPKILFGLTEAQVVSIFMILGGIIGLYILPKLPAPSAPPPLTRKQSR